MRFHPRGLILFLTLLLVSHGLPAWSQSPDITQPFATFPNDAVDALPSAGQLPTLDPELPFAPTPRFDPLANTPTVPASRAGTHPAAESHQPQRVSPAHPSAGSTSSETTSFSIEDWVSPERFRGSASTFALIGMLSLAPALLLMTTSFVRLSIVFTLLRQAIGAQILPNNQILTTLAMFLTVCIMWPTWIQVYEEAIVPYTDGSGRLNAEQAWEKGVAPVRDFMSRQIEMSDNSENIVMFYQTLPDMDEVPESYDDVPLQILLPAYLLSELKIAFLLGFQVYLPFLVIDVFVSAVTASMGMLMLPPMSISLPLKLIVFVLVDGWNLLAGTLITSFMVTG